MGTLGMLQLASCFYIFEVQLLTITEVVAVGLALLPGLKHVKGRSGVNKCNKITEKAPFRSESLEKGCGLSNSSVWE